MAIRGAKLVAQICCHMNQKLIFWSVVVALDGPLFGMDVPVISAAEQEIQQLWHLSSVLHSHANRC